MIKNIKNDVSDEVNDKVTNDFENKINSLNRNEIVWLNVKIKAWALLVVKTSKNVDLNFFW